MSTLDDIAPVIEKVAIKLQSHVEGEHPNFWMGTHDIAHNLKTYGYGIIRKFASPLDVCWPLNTFVMGRGEEACARENTRENRISGNVIQTQAKLEDVKDFFTVQEPYIDSPFWNQLKPFFDSLNDLGKMLIFKQTKWENEAAFDVKISFLWLNPAKVAISHLRVPYP